jgi:curved DNA-binding protein CbpA
METDRDLYQILQIDPAAEPEVVQAAYKRLAFKYHPDKNQSAEANRRMQELNEAYAIIGDPFQRTAYDRQRQNKIAAQRQAEDQAHYQAESERRADATRQRKEQMSAQRRAETERQAQAYTAAAQRRVEYEEQIRAQQAAQRAAKHERQQREWEAQQTSTRPASPVQSTPPIEMPAPAPIVMPEMQAEVKAEQGPIGQPRLSESARRQIALRQSCRALQNEIFKLDYGITDATERIKYWNNRPLPWDIELLPGQRTPLLLGSAATLMALLVAGFMLASGGGIAWAACGFIGCGVGWLTWCQCVTVLPAKYMAEAWGAIKRSRTVQQRKLKVELAQLQSGLPTNADDPADGQPQSTEHS